MLSRAGGFIQKHFRARPKKDSFLTIFTEFHHCGHRLQIEYIITPVADNMYR